MKITVEMEDELNHALELHLQNGLPMQIYLRAAVRFFRDAYKQENDKDMTVGFGRKDNFARYNTEMSPKKYLAGIEGSPVGIG